MKKLFIPLLLILSLPVFSQVSVGAPITETNRWTFGGGIGLGFGSNSSFSLQAAPRVGYMVTNDLEAGVIGSISWQTSDFYRSTMFGVGPFVNYYFARSFYLGGNFQHYFIDYKDKYYGYKDNRQESALYLGGGYMQRIGGNSFMQLGLMYNVLYKERSSIFSSGLVPNIGFVIGL
ncbi:hypothetical protein IQ37_10345 [Chryseobacterium piperi]|uniref:Outer membrane protein beta-barrel domain-containing protein n=1 Tax=Chryseobacterium piperi TaxID=558152 RepID=A0A086BF99_9FLAO|nr:hypothetical protein [Chryseobacterium piperi]ASW75316.1 hypothetical protein CJF12_14155 [Chryseobacterium piperi]KFF27613.1 hypothetical protein IQ37_10345 [Chryseobacterium piperi]